MDIPYYHPSLLIKGSKINIRIDERNKYNKTEVAIVIEGNREGFISFANMINVYSVNLYNSFKISNFDFVNSSIDLTITEKDDCLFRYGTIIKSNIYNEYIWEISEDGLFRIFSLIHSLGYANKELHLDEGVEDFEISIYCVVE